MEAGAAGGVDFGVAGDDVGEVGLVDRVEGELVARLVGARERPAPANAPPTSASAAAVAAARRGRQRKPPFSQRTARASRASSAAASAISHGESSVGAAVG